MRLDCLGSGFAFSNGAYWSGFLLDGRVLLDCPPQTLPHLFRLDVPTTAIDLVLLSHEHSDHIGGVDLFLLEERRAQHDRDARGARGARREGVPRASPLAIAGPPGIYDRLRENHRHVLAAAGARRPAHRVVRTARRVGVRVGGRAGGVRGDGPLAGHRRARVPRAVPGWRRRLLGRHVVRRGAAESRRGRRPAHHGVRRGPRAGPPGVGRRARAAQPPSTPSTRLLVTHYDPLAVPEWARSLDGVELAEDFGVYEI